VTDARLRTLEREAPRDPAARGALLTERLRTGAITQDQIQLAAYQEMECGLCDGGDCDRCAPAWAALEAANAWASNPTEEKRRACYAALPRTAYRAATPGRNAFEPTIYTPLSGRWWSHVLCIIALPDSRGTDSSGAHQSWAHNAVVGSIDLAGEARVRKAISAALIAWGLS